MAEGKSVRRRVAVTGVGLVTPLGVGVEANWSALCTGRSGVGLISRFDPSAFATKIAGEVRDFSAEDYIDRKELRKMDLFIQFALAATVMAMDSSGFQIVPEVAERTGVLVGVGLGGIQTIEESHRQYLLEGKKISPFFYSEADRQSGAGADCDSIRGQGYQLHTNERLLFGRARGW